MHFLAKLTYPLHKFHISKNRKHFRKLFIDSAIRFMYTNNNIFVFD